MAKKDETKKPKRKRRTKAQIEADKKAKAERKAKEEEKKMTAAQQEREFRKKKFLEIFPKKLYHIGKTCEAVGIHRNTLRLWRDTDEVFANEYLALLEQEIDDDEEMLTILKRGIPIIKNGKLTGWTKEPDFRALKLSLEAKGRKRGYGQQITINDDREEERDMSDEELFAEIERTKIFKENARGKD